MRKADTPTPVPGQLSGRRRWDASLAGYVIVGVAVVLAALLAVAAYLYVHVGLDLSAIAKDLVAPGSVGALLLTAAGWVLRERLAPQQGGTQREVGAVREQVATLRAQRDADAEQAGHDRVVLGQVSGTVEQVGQRVEGLQEAALLLRRDVSGATAAAQDATQAALESARAVMDLQELLVGAAQAAQHARDAQEAERAQRDAAEEAERAEQAAQDAAAGTRWLTGPQPAVRPAAEPAAPLQGLVQLEAAPVTPATAMPVTPSQPVAPVTPAGATRAPRRITPLDPEWVPPATGMLPVVPPKTDPDMDTGVHTYIYTGKWPDGYDPDNPPPRTR